MGHTDGPKHFTHTNRWSVGALAAGGKRVAPKATPPANVICLPNVLNVHTELFRGSQAAPAQPHEPMEVARGALAQRRLIAGSGRADQCRARRAAAARASGGPPTLERRQRRRQRQDEDWPQQAAPSSGAAPASQLLLLTQAVLGTAAAGVMGFSNVLAGHASLTVVAAEVAADAGGRLGRGCAHPCARVVCPLDRFQRSVCIHMHAVGCRLACRLPTAACSPRSLTADSTCPAACFWYVLLPPCSGRRRHGCCIRRGDQRGRGCAHRPRERASGGTAAGGRAGRPVCAAARHSRRFRAC